MFIPELPQGRPCTPFSVGDEGTFPSQGAGHTGTRNAASRSRRPECQAPACLAAGSDMPFVLGTLKTAAVLPGIRHCLVTKAPVPQSLNPIILPPPPAFRITVENALHWQLLDMAHRTFSWAPWIATTACSILANVTPTSVTLTQQGLWHS